MAAEPGAEVQRLYALPREAFVEARNALAARLQKAGQRAAAAEVRRLRKPDVVAWAVNQAAREDGAAVSRLLEAVDDLKRAHARSAGDLAQRLEQQRSALRGLVGRADAAMRRAGIRATGTTLDRTSATLLGAAADPAARAALQRGMLTEALPAPGFEVFADTPVTAPAAPRTAVTRAREALRVAEAEAEDWERRAQELERAAAQHRAAAAEAERSARSARQRADELEQRAREERQAAQQAALAAERARADAGRAAARREAAARALGPFRT